MSSDLQIKTTQFNTLAFDIRTQHKDFFRGKTLAKMFTVGRSEENKPIILFPKSNLPEDIKEQLILAFNSIFNKK
jgi:hypothetical protein